jgi:hypothetical protein
LGESTALEVTICNRLLVSWPSSADIDCTASSGEENTQKMRPQRQTSNSLCILPGDRPAKERPPRRAAADDGLAAAQITSLKHPAPRAPRTG